jgi:hypothetical protein
MFNVCWFRSVDCHNFLSISFSSANFSLTVEVSYQFLIRKASISSIKFGHMHFVGERVESACTLSSLLLDDFSNKLYSIIERK